jgi:AraC family transcriptional regulator of adaptative response/methylated-DNA-[protein]-cysteine methyltransferase
MNRTNKNEPLATATMNDPRWAAIVARAPDADGKFFYSVKTTGVYCRPSCAARVARPENVAFHLTAADAERAGFRPCKRCKPDQASLTDQRAAKIAELSRFIEGAESPPTLDQLARHAGMSAYHLTESSRTSRASAPRHAAAHGKRVRQNSTAVER